MGEHRKELPKHLQANEKRLVANRCNEPSMPSSRDNKTAIELFLAGVQGLEAGVRRKLEDGKL